MRLHIGLAMSTVYVPFTVAAVIESLALRYRMLSCVLYMYNVHAHMYFGVCRVYPFPALDSVFVH